MALTAEQRSLRSRIAAYATNARHDGRAITATARATYRDSFSTGHRCAVCPLIELPEGLSQAERNRRSESLRRMHYTRLALASSRSRSKKKGGPDRNSARPMEAANSDGEHPKAA